jgi:acyl-coenzyme A thioesterase PaaI-like protein
MAGRLPAPPIMATLGIKGVEFGEGRAVFEVTPAEYHYNPLDLDTRFIRPITSGTGRLLCEGTVDYIGARTALARARLVNSDGKLFAQATSNCLIFRPGE